MAAEASPLTLSQNHPPTNCTGSVPCMAIQAVGGVSCNRTRRKKYRILTDGIESKKGKGQCQFQGNNGNQNTISTGTLMKDPMDTISHQASFSHLHTRIIFQLGQRPVLRVHVTQLRPILFFCSLQNNVRTLKPPSLCEKHTMCRCLATVTAPKSNQRLKAFSSSLSHLQQLVITGGPQVLPCLNQW